ncbi:hypothetical protein ACOSQ2_003171 [Xanthoceras sorbifolium]
MLALFSKSSGKPQVRRPFGNNSSYDTKEQPARALFALKAFRVFFSFDAEGTKEKEKAYSLLNFKLEGKCRYPANSSAFIKYYCTSIRCINYGSSVPSSKTAYSSAPSIEPGEFS